MSIRYSNKHLLSALLAAGFAMPSLAVNFDVTVENITPGLYMTPLLVVAYPEGNFLLPHTLNDL